METDIGAALWGGILARCRGVLVVVHGDADTTSGASIVAPPAASSEHARAAEVGAQAALRVTLGRPLAPRPAGDPEVWLRCVEAARKGLAAAVLLAIEELQDRNGAEEALRWLESLQAAPAARAALDRFGAALRGRISDLNLNTTQK